MSTIGNSSGAGKFPTPKVNDAQIFPAEVIGENGIREMKNVLSSSSGQFYEFNLVIKKSIYGLVVKANVLEPVEVDGFRRTGKVVAIKVFAKDLLQKRNDASMENPLVEIAAMQDLGEPRHPNLAHQYECCVDEKNVYSVLQFHQGVELFDHVLNNGPLDEDSARKMFRQLIRGLARLEQRSICHRDISLENIMYNAEDHSTTIIDFGLCVKLRQENGQVVPISNVVCGKGHYMAPEAAWAPASSDDDLDLLDDDVRSSSRSSFQGEEFVNPQLADVWSAGMCLLYVLLGFPPIESATRDDVRFSYIVAGRLAELVAHWEVDLSEEVLDLINSILKEDPAERLTLEQIWNHAWMRTSEVDAARNPSPCAEVCTGLYLNNNQPPAKATAATVVVAPQTATLQDASSEICSVAVLAPLQHPATTSVIPVLVPEQQLCSMDECEDDYSHVRTLGCSTSASTPGSSMCYTLSNANTPKTRGQSFEIVSPTSCDITPCSDMHSSGMSLNRNVTFQYMQQQSHYCVQEERDHSTAETPTSVVHISTTCCSEQGSEFSTAVNSPTSTYSATINVSVDESSCSFDPSLSKLQNKINALFPVVSSNASSVASSAMSSPSKVSSNKVRPYHSRRGSKVSHNDFHF